MGNPHCVVLIDENMDLNNVPLNKWGPALENFHIFPKKTKTIKWSRRKYYRS